MPLASACLSNREQPLDIMQQSLITVLLVDDHALLRQGLRTLLEGYPDVQVVGEACNGEEALGSVERLCPAVVVMDINMPKLNGIEATARLKARYPDLIVIGLSVNAEEENQEAMKSAGASRLISKDVAVEQLYAAIKEISCSRASVARPRSKWRIASRCAKRAAAYWPAFSH